MMAMLSSPPTPVALAVDVACFALDDEARLRVLLVKRKDDPFARWWALPGIAVHDDEELDAAALRALSERAGIENVSFFEQLYTFGAPRRDPRGRTVAVAYYALLPSLSHATPGRGVEAVD